MPANSCEDGIRLEDFDQIIRDTLYNSYLSPRLPSPPTLFRAPLWLDLTQVSACCNLRLLLDVVRMYVCRLRQSSL